jgi:hypothetical protein
MANESAIKEQDLDDVLTASTAILSSQHINYAVIGGMAAGFRTEPCYTKDVDFLLQVPCDMLTTIREWTQQHMTTRAFRGIRVDWLKPVIPLYEHVLDRACEESWQGLPIRVAAAEGLILIKLLAYRTQDRLDIEKLVAAHRDTLDLDWVKSE